MPEITYATLLFSGFNSKRYYSVSNPFLSNVVRYTKSNHSFVDGNFEFNKLNDEYTISYFSTIPACLGPGDWIKLLSRCYQSIYDEYINGSNNERWHYNKNTNTCHKGRVTCEGLTNY